MCQRGRLGWGAAPIMALLVAATSCTKARSDAVGTRRCVSWQDEIGPSFTARCVGCHGGAAPAAGYDTSSYAGVLGGGSDPVPNATAGDPDSRLVTAIEPGRADAIHQGVTDLFPSVRTWVVDCDLTFVRSSIHQAGILDPASKDFHGRLIRDQSYKFSVCQGCHGADFSGGSSGVSCLGCHAEGPTACSTCHGAIADSGSHAPHLGGPPLGKTYGCGECHRVPTAYTDVGHIFLADGSLDPPPAEVVLGATAALTPAGGVRTAPPSFDPATKSCDNIYCHGATIADSAATNQRPVWGAAAGTGQSYCGTCHGLPPNHAGTAACVSCHPSVVDAAGTIISIDKHIDGQIQLADPASGCAGCHGSMLNPAPPRGLTGQTAATAPGVGAHQAHLSGASRLRGPIACTECHRVPADVFSPGHFSGHAGGADLIEGAEVFSTDPIGTPGVGALASADGAQPRWDRATGTCGGVYCHGGGAALAGDTTSDIDRAPLWTATGGLVCGSACHGLPPAFPPHLSTMSRTDCVSCHPGTVDPAGVVIISGPAGAETSHHVNGVLDVAR